MSSSDVTPAALGKVPAALRLPEECWTQILEHCQFTYKGLKEVMRVCKKIKRSVKVSYRVRKSLVTEQNSLTVSIVCYQGKVLEGIIFRLGPQPPKKPKQPFARGEEIPIHPMLDNLSTPIIRTLNEAVILDEDSEEIYLVHYPTILNEFATSPASIEMRIQFKRVDPFVLKDSKGLTVRQVLVGIAKVWNSTPPPDVVRRVKRGEHYVEDEDGPVTWVHALKGHESWDSWEGAVAEAENYTTLIARDTFD